MRRNALLSLGLFVLLAVSQVATAGSVKFALTPSDPTVSAQGNLQVVNGKPTDTVCRFHLSLDGLNPYASYYLRVSGPDGYQWSVGVFADDRGSCVVRGGTGNQLCTATNVEILDGMTLKVLATGN